MNPLNKIQTYATNLNLNHITRMRPTNVKTATPSLLPVFSTKLHPNPEIYLTYVQTAYHEGTILLQHMHNSTIIQAVTKDIKESRKLNIPTLIQEMLNELLAANTHVTDEDLDAES